jgi:DNA-binding MarR family transcriptional regulator
MPNGRADDVLELVHTVMHLYRSQQFKLLRDADQGITHMESKVLGFFARHPTATQSDLVAHSGRDKGQLARLINGLKDRGLLEAHVDDADRRSVRLQLTTAGKAANQELRRQARRLSTVATKGFAEVDRAQLLALLNRVRDNLEAAQSAD